MAVSKSLRRLLRVRQLEEEQRRAELESALGAVNRLRHALEWTAVRQQRGRLLIDMSAHSGELDDRLAGMEETETAASHSTALERMIADAEEQANALRESYLSKRVERLQAETLIDEGEALEAVEENRHEQQSLDDWHQSRRRVQLSANKRSESLPPQS